VVHETENAIVILHEVHENSNAIVILHEEHALADVIGIVIGIGIGIVIGIEIVIVDAMAIAAEVLSPCTREHARDRTVSSDPRTHASTSRVHS
jgi:hypothetical protein